MPFIAVWKNDPKVRSGMKNSADRKITANAANRGISPFANCTSATTMPTAAPPYANTSITVTELSCMRRRRMVARRNVSASSFIKR